MVPWRCLARSAYWSDAYSLRNRFTYIFFTVFILIHNILSPIPLSRIMSSSEVLEEPDVEEGDPFDSGIDNGDRPGVHEPIHLRRSSVTPTFHVDPVVETDDSVRYIINAPSPAPLAPDPGVVEEPEVPGSLDDLDDTQDVTGNDFYWINQGQDDDDNNSMVGGSVWMDDDSFLSFMYSDLDADDDNDDFSLTNMSSSYSDESEFKYS